MLIDAWRFRDAFELLCPLARQAPDRKGSKEQTQRLVFLEAQRALEAGDLESALPRWRSCTFRTAITPSFSHAWARWSKS